MDYSLFMNKFQPLIFKDFDFDSDNEIVNILNTLIDMNNLNILFIGDMGSGKTSILNAIIREYYVGFTQNEYKDNILHINNLKEQANAARDERVVYSNLFNKI